MWPAVRRLLSLLSARSRRQEALLLELLRKLDTMVTQSDIDAITDKLQAIETRLPTATTPTGVDLDLSGLRNAVDVLDKRFPAADPAPADTATA